MVSERISTGIARLDRLLHGGYIKGRCYLLTGDTGTGKTIACLQFLIHSLVQGEKAVYVTVDERPAEILESAASFSWDLQQHIQEKNLVILDASPYFGARSGSEKGIDPQKIVADLGSYARDTAHHRSDHATHLANRRKQLQPGPRAFADAVDSVPTEHDQSLHRPSHRSSPKHQQ